MNTHSIRLTILFIIFLISEVLYSQPRTIHVLVALCDNENQGIVPVPKKIGNGQDPVNNLYWGCGFGVKTFIKKQPEWILLSQENNPSDCIYERLIFKHRDSLIYLIADAYNGAKIRETTIDFLDYASGTKGVIVGVKGLNLWAGGKSDLICYVGHDGLMDFTLDNFPEMKDTDKREVIILACASRSYFYKAIKKTGAYPLVWTTNLMCPEAYTLDAAVDSWINKDTPADTREKVAQAYNQYQKCGISGARNLFTTGF
jgi:hypothetical protein